MRKVIVVVFGLLLTNTLVGQSDLLSAKQKRVVWDAETAYEKGDYLSTIQELKTLGSFDERLTKVNYLIGDSYFMLEQYDSAKAYLKSGSAEYVDAYFKLAYLSLNAEMLEDASSYLERYEERSLERKSKIPAFESAQLKSNIRFAEEQLRNPDIVNIINLGAAINTEEHEYVPLITADEEQIIFTSRRVNDSEGLDPFNEPFENVYSSQSSDGKDWSEAKLIGGEIKTTGHDACVGLSPDGNTLYLFRTSDNLVGGDLYESLFIDGKWTTPVRMSKNINGILSVEPSASISLDGSTFYFSSNREGGFGGFDLYRVVKLPNGEWSLPLNLGPGVNTIFDEDAPFIHPDGKTLYFSSKGFQNMGGYDIFKSESKEGVFQTPTNLSYPTNSTKDDIYFTISANEQHGYYSSDKKGGFGKQDIYRIDYLRKSLRQSVISAKVTVDGKPSFTEISLIDLETGDLVGVFSSNPTTGKFIFIVNPDVEYELVIEGEAIPEYSEILNYTVEQLLEKQNKIIDLKGGVE